MNIALFFITHEGIASNLLNVGESIIKRTYDNIAYKEVPMDADIDLMMTEINEKLSALDIKDGLVFITDIYGSTPSNIAHKLATTYKTNLISGVNMPMIIRLLNYRYESKEALIEKALGGACKGVQNFN